MTTTPNLHLAQWEPGDTPALDQINENLTIIDSAIAYKTRGKVWYGAYTGTGKTGAANLNQIYLTGTPIFLLVRPEQTSGTDEKLLLVYGMTRTSYRSGSDGSGVNVVWGTNSVHWYTTGSNAAEQMNKLDTEYRYFAVTYPMFG